MPPGRPSDPWWRPTGPPYLYSEAVAAPDASLTENKQDQIVQAQVTQAAAFLTENAVPKTAEVDFVAALDLAARGLQGQAGNRVLYAAFNGLSTAGPMDFTQNLLRADPEAVADALEAQGNLVDLSGVHVVLTGLGMWRGSKPPHPLRQGEPPGHLAGLPHPVRGGQRDLPRGVLHRSGPAGAPRRDPCACASGRAPVLPGPGGRAGVG